MEVLVMMEDPLEFDLFWGECQFDLFLGECQFQSQEKRNFLANIFQPVL